MGKITARLRARDIGLEDLGGATDDGAPPVPANFTTITPLVMTPHCHAPSCIRWAGKKIRERESGQELALSGRSFGMRTRGRSSAT